MILANSLRRSATYLVFSLLVSVPVEAASILRTESLHTGDHYTLSVEVVLDAPREKIWRLMTDYDHLPQLSPVIVDSEVLKKEGANRQRMRFTFHPCVLIFCKTIKNVVDIELQPPSDIVVTVDPALSDFRYAVEHWQMYAEGNKTRIQYSAEMVPNFFVPPVIGPWVIKTFLEREVRNTTIKVEALAQQ
jgi:uncharacterized protein YndB with AHSA1/START domain